MLMARGSSMAWHARRVLFPEKFQPSRLPMPIGFQLGIGRIFRIGAGDGHEEALGISEFRSVFLKIASEATP